MSSQLHTPHPNAERFQSLNPGAISQNAFFKAQLRPCKLFTGVLESKVLAVDCGLPSGASLPLQNAFSGYSSIYLEYEAAAQWSTSLLSTSLMASRPWMSTCSRAATSQGEDAAPHSMMTPCIWASDCPECCLCITTWLLV